MHASHAKKGSSRWYRERAPHHVPITNGVLSSLRHQCLHLLLEAAKGVRIDEVHMRPEPRGQRGSVADTVCVKMRRRTYAHATCHIHIHIHMLHIHIHMQARAVRASVGTHTRWRSVSCKWGGTLPS